MEKREIGVQKGVPLNQSFDPDTSNTILSNKQNNGFYGRRNIVINANIEEFLENPLEVLNDNLHYILAQHRINVEEMNYLKSFQKGEHDILKKTRANGEIKINNKHITNYAWEFVNFKKGYYIGKPIKYVDTSEEETADIKYLLRYVKDVKKHSKDLIKYENMLITGLAHTMTIPKRKSFDSEFESPFEYIVLDNENVCVVKSNDIYNTKLFSMCFSKVKKEDKVVDVYTIYYDNVCLQVENDGSYLYLINTTTMPIRDCITEYQFNEQRMGVFEPVINSINTLNVITSNQLDQLEENVNSYLTFENVDAEGLLEHIEEFRAKRILVVETNNPETPAKIGSIKVDLEQSSINKKYEEIEQRMYDIVGVPMPTSSTGQGVSGEAQVYGGGWENAQIIALVDTQYIVQYEEEDLKKFIFASQDIASSKTSNLIPTSIEIKYTINKSNNMMVKAQSMTYFIDKGFTREQALTYCEITDDPQSDGKIADENYINQKKLDNELELEKQKAQKELNEQYSNQEENQLKKEVE